MLRRNDPLEICSGAYQQRLSRPQPALELLLSGKCVGGRKDFIGTTQLLGFALRLPEMFGIFCGDTLGPPDPNSCCRA